MYFQKYFCILVFLSTLTTFLVYFYFRSNFFSPFCIIFILEKEHLSVLGQRCWDHSCNPRGALCPCLSMISSRPPYSRGLIIINFRWMTMLVCYVLCSILSSCKTCPKCLNGDEKEVITNNRDNTDLGTPFRNYNFQHPNNNKWMSLCVLFPYNFGSCPPILMKLGMWSRHI